MGEEHATISLDCILVMQALYMLIRTQVSLMATFLRPRTIPDRPHTQCDDPRHAPPRLESLQCIIAAPSVNELRRPRDLLPREFRLHRRELPGPSQSKP